jgi:hypothetical protein
LNVVRGRITRGIDRVKKERVKRRWRVCGNQEVGVAGLEGSTDVSVEFEHAPM